MPPRTRPTPQEPLYREIVRRLIDSWHLPAGVIQYYQWTNLPDGDTGFSVLGRHVVIDRGLAWRTINVQCGQILADLDHAIPTPLGLVTTTSRRPADLSLNHQVLAYGYERAGSQLTLRVYDPNRGQRDDIHLRLDTANPTRPTHINHNLGIPHAVRGFFRAAYTPTQPPALAPAASASAPPLI